MATPPPHMSRSAAAWISGRARASSLRFFHARGAGLTSKCSLLWTARFGESAPGLGCKRSRSVPQQPASWSRRREGITVTAFGRDE
jgi:hypothetical protein